MSGLEIILVVFISLIASGVIAIVILLSLILWQVKKTLDQVKITFDKTNSILEQTQHLADSISLPFRLASNFKKIIGSRKLVKRKKIML